MDLVNAIAKAKFSSALPQRIPLHAAAKYQIEMLCLEAAQEVRVGGGVWAYYTITGTATLLSGDKSLQVPPGQLAWSEPGEPHRLINRGDSRLVCLTISQAGS